MSNPITFCVALGSGLFWSEIQIKPQIYKLKYHQSVDILALKVILAQGAPCLDLAKILTNRHLGSELQSHGCDIIIYILEYSDMSSVVCSARCCSPRLVTRDPVLGAELS